MADGKDDAGDAIAVSIDLEGGKVALTAKAPPYVGGLGGVRRRIGGLVVGLTLCGSGGSVEWEAESDRSRPGSSGSIGGS